MEESKFSWKKRALSFKYAFDGIKRLISGEHNAWIHCTAALLVTIMAFILEVSHIEWIILLICIGLVLAAEGFNTAIEYLANAITKDPNDNIKHAKDVAAGAVLICAITAAIVGLLIFTPYIIALF